MALLKGKTAVITGGSTGVGLATAKRFVAFTAGLDRILLVAAIIAFAAGVVSLAAIRSRDFAHAAPSGQQGPGK